LSKLVLVRHGQSVWNLENRFTGWVDVPLSKKGIEESISAGEKLKDVEFDVIYVSHMLRSIQTLHYILIRSNSKKTPIIYHEEKRIRDWEHHSGDESKELPIYQSVDLAERYYGDLQGLNKAEMANRYGQAQVHLWRRSYDVNPPGGESLKDTTMRAIPYFKNYILKGIQKDKTILVVAHGNSLRSITMYLENISEQDIPSLEIPTGVPIVYKLDRNMKILEKKLM
jgi:2,3-bisphosphoglycerate-dependent phosphoglycerate mutase